jgi:signal transduction histidine kinase
MTTLRPGRSLFRLLVLPLVGLVLAAVAANVAFAAFLAARRAFAAAEAQQERVADAVESSRIAFSPQVLETLRQLTGCEFLVWNPATTTAGLSTLAPDVLARHDPATIAAAAGGNILLDGRRYHVGTAESRGVRPETVLVLTPVSSLLETTLEAIWPVLAVAGATLAVLVPLGLVATARLARRIVAVERHVATIAAGRFGEKLVDAAAGGGRAHDDIGRLVAGVNHLSGTLAELRTNLVAGERQRLLGQLAAGFAHELRNAVTGARLAIDLHRRRCQATAVGRDDDSLAVATRQLDVLEEEVRGLLALGRPGEAATGPIDVSQLVAEVKDLAGPRSAHAGVTLEADRPAALPSFTGRREALRAALMNLALNAIDAVGRDGRVQIDTRIADGFLELAVVDDGPGPPAALADSLAEPFVTGKQEGIGLGLAVAKAVAEEHGGKLSWSRANGRTRFVIALPLPAGHRHPQGRDP